MPAYSVIVHKTTYYDVCQYHNSCRNTLTAEIYVNYTDWNTEQNDVTPSEDVSVVGLLVSNYCGIVDPMYRLNI